MEGENKGEPEQEQVKEVSEEASIIEKEEEEAPKELSVEEELARKQKQMFMREHYQRSLQQPPFFGFHMNSWQEMHHHHQQAMTQQAQIYG